jgi:hypothetical protein
MPVTMNGSAAGSTMLPQSWRSEQRKARPTSSSLGSTDFTPWYVLMTIGKNANMKRMMIFAVVS